MEITITRVYEEFEIQEVVIPYEQQLQPVEFLPEGKLQPSQPGENGLKEITYRIVYEDGIEISKTEIKVVTIKDPQPQIMLFGAQTSFTPRPITGRMVYLSDGNAWMMEGTTANRIPLVLTEDLDGRVFVLSDDAEWLLFTRRADDEQIINTLWIVQVDNPVKVWKILLRKKICVSPRGRGIRVAVHCYNNEEDIDQLLQELKSII